MNLDELLKGPPVLLLDGATGTQLAAAGLEMGGQSCVSHPDAVVTVHRAYAAAGSDLLTTNTLTMNRISVETHGVAVDVAEVNRAGGRLARQVAGDRLCVLGNLSSTGQMLEPYGTYSEGSFVATFREQAGHLLAAGVDGFLVETMIDAREAACAVRACRAVSSLPVLVTLSFQTTAQGGRTVMGNAAAESARLLADAGATAVGANCGDLDPRETAVILDLMRQAVDLPLIAQPNAGKPRLVGGQTLFDMGPEEFAEGIAACIEAGARLVGGCCGTTPAHIRRVAEALGKGRQGG